MRVGIGDRTVMDIKIETSRLTLRPWAEADIEALTQGLNDLALAKWMAFVPHPYTTSHAREWIARCRGISNAGMRPISDEFAVELKLKRRVIGGVSCCAVSRKIAGTKRPTGREGELSNDDRLCIRTGGELYTLNLIDGLMLNKP